LKRLFFLVFFLCLSHSVSSAAQFGVVHENKRLTSTRTNPIIFEPAAISPGSTGQIVGRVPGAAFHLSAHDVEVQLVPGKQKLRIHFEGASDQTRVQGRDRLSSESNYLVGSNAANWRTHVANYGRATYFSLYPGIDGVFYGNAEQLEHDFIVRPGADYRQIRMKVSAEAHVAMNADGDLLLALPGGQLRMRKPTMYQDSKHGRTTIRGAFAMERDGAIGFKVGSYDPTRTLVIDPVLSFSTYLANASSSDNHVATDAAGATYMTGVADLGYPVTPGAFAGCTSCTQQEVVTYVSKYSADGKTLLYSTLLGGSRYSQPFGITVDTQGNAVVAGYTQATDFPTKSGQPIGANNNSDFAFLTSLAADGASLNYSTLLGGSTSQGSSTTHALALAVDASANAYVSGLTDASAFPITAGALHNGTPAYPASCVFLSKFSPSGSLVYSGIVGDASPQNGGAGLIGVTKIAVDGTGSAYVAGQAGTLWPVTSGAYQQQIPGPQPFAAPFVTKVAADGASIVYSTFFASQYQVVGVAVQPNGNVWLAGSAGNASIPVTADAYQTTPSATFLGELDATGSNLLYATYFGGPQTRAHALALDADGDVFIAGQTSDAQLALVKPLQSTYPSTVFPGGTSFLAQFDPTGKTLKFSTFLGGTAPGGALGIALDPSHHAHVGGFTQAGLYTTPGVYLSQVPANPPNVTSVYGYAALIDPTADAPALCIAYPANGGLYFPDTAAGTTLDETLTLTSCGTLPLSITSIQTASGPFSVPADKDQCPESLPVGQSCSAVIRFTPTAKNNYTSTVTVVSNAPVTEAVVPLTGSGVVPQLSASGVLFDYTLVGQSSAPANVFLQNAGGAAVTLDFANTTISGDFTIASQACATIAPGSACVVPIVFTPKAAGERTGTLRIASNDPASPIVSVTLDATGYSAAPVPQITAVDHPAIAAGSTGLSLQVNGFGFLPTSVVQLNGKAQTTTYNQLGWLTATLDANAIPASGYGEIFVTVMTPAPGGGTSNPYVITLFDRFYTQNGGLIYEPVGKKLYVSVPANGVHNANTILPIDPVTSSVGTPIPVGNDPAVLAASSDGHYLYVGLNAAHSLQRINLTTGLVERTFALPSDPYLGPLRVFDLHAVPGTPTAVVAVLFANASPAEDGIALFNDSGLVNYIPGIATQYGMPSVALDSFTFVGTDSTRLYGLPFDAGQFFAIVTLDSTGLHYTRPTGGSGNNPPNPGLSVVSDGTLLYTNSGEVWDPKTQQLLHTYPVSTLAPNVVPDTAQGKTYFMDPWGTYNQSSAMSIRAFDQSTLAETGRVSFAQDSGSYFPTFGTGLLRWGKNGFAFRYSDFAGSPQADSVVTLTSSITAIADVNPTPTLAALSPATLAAGGPDFILTVTGTGFVPGSTVQWNDTPRLTTFISGTTLTATIYASDIAAGGAVHVDVISPAPGGGITAVLGFNVTGGSVAPQQLTVSPGSLTFASQIVASSSAPQVVALQNAGQSDITGLAVALAGAAASSFSSTNNCAAVLASSASCQISVVFSPQSAGSASASLSITSSASGSAQIVSLSGTATQAAFTVAPPSSGSNTTTVTSGQTADYNLVLTPATGYSGNLALSCGSLPAHAACAFTPPSLAVSNGSPINFTVAISTTDAQAHESTSPFRKTGPLLGLALLPLWCTGRKQGRKAILGALYLLLLAVTTGCGGNNSSTPTQPASVLKVAPGTYTVEVIATDGVTTSKTPLSLIVQ
jgi:hypothetical protein